MVLTTSPQQSFQPRKEFLRKQGTSHHFSLVTFNGADILRLSHFPAQVIAGLRKLFEEQDVFRFYREDGELQVAEFVLADKMWSGKSTRSERLVTQIFAVLLAHQFRYVTSLNYGRLPQDSQSLVFSRVASSANGTLGAGKGSISSRANSPHSANFPLPPPSTGHFNVPPSPLGGGSLKIPPSESNPMSRSGSAIPQPNIVVDTSKTVFALSLTSKSLKVINAPRTSTPAILASVRSAWPRGVISENKTSDEVYEFKLKGYSMFSSSTFERDALAHIFTLLRTLDTHSFSLIMNLTLTQGLAKSRTKDLWIFEAPADDPSPDASPRSEGSPELGTLNNRGEKNLSVMSDAGFAGLGAVGSFSSSSTGATPLIMADGKGSHSPTTSHHRAATTPQTYPREKGKEKEYERDHGHVRGATSPTSNPTDGASVERSHSLLKKKISPTAFSGTTASRNIFRRSSKGSIKAGQGGQRGDVDPLPIYPQYQHEQTHEHRPVTARTETDDIQGPLTESQYDFDYPVPVGMASVNFDGKDGGHHSRQVTNSAHLYQPYSGEVLYSSNERVNRTHTTPPYNDRDSDANILHGDAFRDTAFTDDRNDTHRVPVNWTGTTPEEEVYQREYGAAVVNAPSGVRTGRAIESTHVLEGDIHHKDESNWRKSEKGVIGIVEDVETPPMPDATHYVRRGQGSSAGGESHFVPGMMNMPTPSNKPSAVPVPIPSHAEENRGNAMGFSLPPGGPDRLDSTATMLLPGAFPKTPPALSEKHSSSMAPIPQVVTGDFRSISPQSGGSGQKESSGKGWVLVNVESSSHHAGPRTSHYPSAKNGSPEQDAIPMVVDPHTATTTRGHEGDELDLASPTVGGGFRGPTVTPTPRKRKGSLKKKQKRRTSGGSIGKDASVGRRRFLGLFGSRRRKPNTTAAAANTGVTSNAGVREGSISGDDDDDDDEGDEEEQRRDDAEGAMKGVTPSSATWRKPKEPSRVKKLTIG